MLRRYTELKPSRGTEWPAAVRAAITERDPICVGRVLGLPPSNCFGPLELDHVRASGALSKKSRSTVDNGVRLCSAHHRYKGEHGRDVRPRLIDYIDAHEGHSAHVDPCGPLCTASKTRAIGGGTE